MRDFVVNSGLMEVTLKCQQGFVLSMPFDRFLARYKLLTQYTWPNFRGKGPKEAIQVSVLVTTAMVTLSLVELSFDHGFSWHKLIFFTVFNSVEAKVFLKAFESHKLTIFDALDFPCLNPEIIFDCSWVFSRRFRRKCRL